MERHADYLRPHDNRGIAGPGRIYHIGLDGTLIRTYVNPTSSDGDAYGRALAVDGDQLLASALFDDTDGYSAGAIYLYDLNNGQLLQRYRNPDTAPIAGNADWFGKSIAMIDDFVLVGSPQHHGMPGQIRGAVHIYDRDSGALLRTIQSPVPFNGQMFGESIALIGNDRVLIGAPGQDGLHPGGTVFLFDFLSGDRLATYKHPGDIDDAAFGYSVGAVRDGTPIVSATNERNDSVPRSGAIYLYGPNDDPFRIGNPTPDGSEGFGLTLASYDNDILVGAYRDANSGIRAGGVYLFEGIVPEPSSWALVFSAALLGTVGAWRVRRSETRASSQAST